MYGLNLNRLYRNARCLFRHCHPRPIYITIKFRAGIRKPYTFPNLFEPPHMPTHKQLVTGVAEVYGTEMVIGKVYMLRATNIAVFSWKGGTVKLSGNAVGPYVAKETPMLSYVNVHAALDQRRAAAAAAGGNGPRAMIVGPANVGKSTLAMILANYAARVGRRPVKSTTVHLILLQGTGRREGRGRGSWPTHLPPVSSEAMPAPPPPTLPPFFFVLTCA